MDLSWLTGWLPGLDVNTLVWYAAGFVFVVIMFARKARIKRKKDIDTACLPYVQNKKIQTCTADTLERKLKGLIGDTIAVLDVKGPIFNRASEVPAFAGMVTATFAEKIYRALDLLGQSERVRGVLARFDTPGGTESGSRCVSDGILVCRGHGKSVIVHVSNMSASGGVMAMVAADKVFADAVALVGSVGVRGPRFLQYKDVTGYANGIFGDSVRGRISVQAISAGRGKMLGDPFVESDADALRSLQGAVDECRERFHWHLFTMRDIPITTFQDHNVGAAIFSASEAQRLGLVDVIGSEESAANCLAHMALPDLSFDRLTFLHVRFPTNGGLFGKLSERALRALDPVFGLSRAILENALSKHKLLLLSPLW